MYTIILFYKYVKIKATHEEMVKQRAVCEALGLFGRMIVAEEGINGTFEGTTENIEKYITWMNGRKGFMDIHWKKSAGTGEAFPRLSIKVRNEIVSLHLGKEKDIDPRKFTGAHLKPEKLKEWYDQGKEFYIVDMRNSYELKVGKFENTVFPGMENFRDLKEKVNEIKNLKDKTVLTVCTGGVRCEKASGYLKREGFTDVHQLDGGIVSYMEKYPGQDFKGSLYVFDNRITMHFDKPETHEVIGVCGRCGEKSEHYINCGNQLCHEHIICCEQCVEAHAGIGYCSDSCKEVSSPQIA